MSGSVEQALLYATIPVLAVLVGGIAALVWTPGRSLESAIQHFTAGVVFAAVAVELLPDLTHEQSDTPVIIGFALGVAAMLAMRRFVDKLTGESEESRNPSGLVLAVAVDMLIDGLLVGISFAAGAKQGVLITMALAIELLFLSLSTSSSLVLAGATRRRTIATTVALAALTFGGAAIGTTLLAGLAGAPLVAVLAFAAAALLYLVTEELLVEAHQQPDSTVATTMFFVGFLLLLILRSLG